MWFSQEKVNTWKFYLSGLLLGILDYRQSMKAIKWLRVANLFEVFMFLFFLLFYQTTGRNKTFPWFVGKSLRKHCTLKLHITSAFSFFQVFPCVLPFRDVNVASQLMTSENFNFQSHENHKIWKLPHITSFEWSISVECSKHHHHSCAFHIILADGLSWK